MTAASLLDLYLDEIRRVRATGAGTAETSYYPAISLLLNAAGAKFKPRIYCLHHPSGDAGIPDFGLFEQSQSSRRCARLAEAVAQSVHLVFWVAAALAMVALALALLFPPGLNPAQAEE